jgi:Putative MetA-pathway of phenol degradation
MLLVLATIVAGAAVSANAAGAVSEGAPILGGTAEVIQQVMESGKSKETLQEPASGGPPMIIDDPGTVDKKHWEIITAVAGNHQGDTLEVDPTLDVNYGAADNVQIHFLVPYVTQSTKGEALNNGTGNTTIGFKYRFVGDAKNGLALGIFPQVSFNNGSSSVNKGLVDKGIDVFLPLDIQETIRKFTFDGHVGFDFKPQGIQNQFFYGVMGGYNMARRVQILAELVADSTTDLQEHEAYLNLGNRVTLGKRINLLVSGGHSLHRVSGKGQFIYYVALQTTIEPSKSRDTPSLLR